MPQSRLPWTLPRPSLLFTLLMIGSVGMQVCPADDQPIPDRESLLKTFVDEFVLIAPGVEQFPQSFEMGSEASPEEQPKHPVTLARPFHMAKYEVPQNLYEAVMGENPSRWKGPRNSVEMITWTDANTFCESVTALLREAHLIEQNDSIRLPSEAEWEYCCRAGTDTAYSFGDQATSPDDEGNKASLLDPYAWHTGNAAGNDPPVGALKANPWGLYDMHGYLWEFTADHWQDDHQSAPTDGSPRISSEEDAPIVVRGGSWKDRHPRLRSAARQSFKIDARDDAVGFRCVMDKAG